MYFNNLDKTDHEVSDIIRREMSRQENKLEMIASENFTSKAVMEACGSELTNKYAEGYPGKRYYGGCEHVDEVETLAIERMKKLFSAEYANVQPHSGASAYPRIIDTRKFREIADEVGAILMVDMAHIAGLVAAGIYPNPMEYADVVTTTTHKTLRGPRGGAILAKAEYGERLNKAVFPGIQGGPLMHIIAGKAVCFKEAMEPSFIEYQKQVVANAKILAQELINKDFKLVSGGTDNHLILLNLINKGITGEKAELLLDEANITCNKNTIPNDPYGANVTAGIRLGTPAMTTRGFKEAEIVKVADVIALVLNNPESIEIREEAKAIVEELCERFPLH